MSTQDQENEREKSQNSPQSTTGAQPGIDKNQATDKDKNPEGNYQGSEGGSAESFGQQENDVENFGRLNTAEGKLNSNISERAHAERPKIDKPDPQAHPETDQE